MSHCKGSGIVNEVFPAGTHMHLCSHMTVIANSGLGIQLRCCAGGRTSQNPWCWPSDGAKKGCRLQMGPTSAYKLEHVEAFGNHVHRHT
jgi:hypothetical protein